MSKYSLFRCILNLSAGLQLLLGLAMLGLLMVGVRWGLGGSALPSCATEFGLQPDGGVRWRLLVFIGIFFVWIIPFALLLLYDLRVFWRFRVGYQDREEISVTLKQIVSPELWLELQKTFCGGIFSATQPGEALTMGFLRPRLFLGCSLLAELNRDQLQCVLFHELEHARAKDCFWGLIAIFASRAWWFLPKRNAALTRRCEQIEMLTDHQVIAKLGGCRDLYVDTLMRVLNLQASSLQFPHRRSQFASDFITSKFAGDIIPSQISIGSHVVSKSAAQLSERLRSIYGEREVMRLSGSSPLGSLPWVFLGSVCLMVLVSTTVMAVVPIGGWRAGAQPSLASRWSASLVCSSLSSEGENNWWGASERGQTRKSSHVASQTIIPK